jgi:hypothetical protein
VEWTVSGDAPLDKTPVEVFPVRAGQVVVGERVWHERTFRQVMVNCGKARCKRCKAGACHGPYWYAYWREGGRVRCRYYGKETPWGQFSRGEIDWQGNPITPAE